MVALAGLFLAAFAAATMIPAQSEAELVALIVSASEPIWVLLVVAIRGKVLGSVVNWAIGRLLIRFSNRRRFQFLRTQTDKVTGWYALWGHRSLHGDWIRL